MAGNNPGDKELLRLNRAYRVINKCSKALTKTQNELDLMRSVCSIVVEDGGYLAAWVGTCDMEENNRIVPLVHHGMPDRVLKNLQITFKEGENTGGPSASAVQKREPVVCRNINTDPVYSAWKGYTENLRYNSSISLPIKGENTVFGVLNIYSAAEDAFTEDERGLLQELADDLSFGIGTLRTMEEWKNYQIELKKRIKELQGLFQLNILVDNNISIPVILEKFTREILPNSMKLPHLIECRTEFDGLVYVNKRSEGNNVNTYSVPIFTNRSPRGNIAVSYPEKELLEIEQVEFSVLRAFADKIGKFITRIEAQEELEANKKRFQNILDSLPDIVFEIDRAMRITWANKKALEANEAAFGKLCHQVYHNRSKPCPNCPSVKALETGEIKRGSVYFSESSDGKSEQYLENIGVPIIDPDNNILGVVEIARDITETHQSKEKLERYNRELRNLSHHLQLVREEERKNISREIHDELGQALTAIKMDAYWINKHIPEEELQLRQKTADMLLLVDETVQNVQKLINDLRLGFPEDLDFQSSLEWLIEDFMERSRIDVSFSIDLFPDHIQYQSSLTAFRILQESLTNISRHAKGDKVEISIKNTDNTVALSITDNGVGISEKEIYSASSYGIIGMRERCQSLGGHLEIRSTPGKGTEISATIPLSPHYK